jgi:integrase/recombinase XerD
MGIVAGRKQKEMHLPTEQADHEAERQEPPLPAVAAAPLRPSSTAGPLPALIAQAGPAAGFAWEEFFAARLRNPHTRAAYLRAVRQFLEWATPQGLTLPEISPGMVGAYFDQHPGSTSTKKLHLPALRAFFDCLVVRHVVVLNPAATVRGERYEVVERLTPEITPEQARQLLGAIDTSTLAGLRDRAIIGVLIYTAARAGAVAKLRLKHLEHDGTQYVLRFAEKGHKLREIPVRHDLQEYLLAYRYAAMLDQAPPNSPLFRTLEGKADRLTGDGVTGLDICRMVKRRLRAAGLPERLSPHSFRVCTVTDLLSQGVPPEDVQYLAGHADPRTTRLYDRRQKRVTRNIVERLSI